MSILIKSGRIIDPHQGLDFISDLWLQDGVVNGLSKHMDVPPQTRVIDAEGLVVCPGFIDIHCHLREPGDEDKETIATGTAAAARGGFTTVCAMPNTRPPIDSVDMVNLLLDKAQNEGMVRILPIACVTQGRDGKALTNMEELARAGAIAFSDDGSPVSDDGLMQQALNRAAALGSPISNHCEDLGISNGGVMNEGELATSLGLKGWPASAEETMVARDIALAEATGGPLHLAHVSTAGSVELVRRAKERGVSVTAEATPHHLTITEICTKAKTKQGYQRLYDTNAKVNPPLRTQQDVDAVVRGLADGVIDCIATDHAPHTRADKDSTFEEAAFGISGLETALGSLLSLVHGGHLDMTTLVERLTTGPARVLNRPDLCPATLQPGSRADVTIFDPNAEWVVDANSFVSKGKNTPLDGTTLRGRVVLTIVAGNVVYEDEAVKVG
ncbi:MAG: dihydroorotase [Chloroflexi bacterium]|nr:dihydroorotase [Chloroflexota bacterium]